jgi:glycosyltransferase involved in cell wall biosynthesis
VNDGSTDNTLKIIQKYAEADKRIHVIDQPNKGISTSNNEAIKVARGKYFAKLDADDRMRPNRLEIQVAYLEANPEVSMLSCQAYYINKHGKVIGEQIIPNYNTAQESALAKQEGNLVVAIHTGFITYLDRIRQVHGYREDLPCVVDLDLFTRMIQQNNVLIILQDRLVEYRMHLTSVMALALKNNKMQVIKAWLSDTYSKQAKGIPTLSLEEFEQTQKNEKFLTKFIRHCANLSYHFRRNAIVYYGDKAYLPFIYSLTMATLLQPNYIFKRLVVWGKRKIKHKK